MRLLEAQALFRRLPSGEVWKATAFAGAMAAALGVTMCVGAVRAPEAERSRPEPNAAVGPSRAPTRVPSTVSPGSLAAAPAGPVAREPSPPSATSHPLAGFFTQLRELKTSERSEPVRIVWLGDSHTAADFWSEVVRSGLQHEFGDAGPGLIHVGLKAYRHGQVRNTVLGSWRLIPPAPSSFQSQSEGVFGLGGLGTAPKDAKASVRLEVRDPGLGNEEMVWRFGYRLPGVGSRFEIQLGSETHAVTTMQDVSDAGIGHVQFEAPARSALWVHGFRGSPELFGVVLERKAPGVVLDTLGINGARVLTAVSWQRQAWVAELAQRQPSLIVLAYGANEVGDGHAPWRYKEAYRELIARAHAAAPDVECLLVGTTERDLPDWTTNPRVLQIEEVQRATASELGCGFFSVIDAMGGVGALRTWAFAKPPLAAKDRIHLTPSGYRLVGEQLLHTLLDSYAERYPK